MGPGFAGLVIDARAEQGKSCLYAFLVGILIIVSNTEKCGKNGSNELFDKNNIAFPEKAYLDICSKKTMFKHA